MLIQHPVGMRDNVISPCFDRDKIYAVSLLQNIFPPGKTDALFCKIFWYTNTFSYLKRQMYCFTQTFWYPLTSHSAQPHPLIINPYVVFFTLWLVSCPNNWIQKCKNVVIGKMKINDYDQLLTVAAVYNAYLCRVNTYIPRCNNGIVSRTWIERWKINDYGELPTATNSLPPRTRGKTTALIKGVLTYLRFHALGILTKPYRTKTNHTIPNPVHIAP